jgi:hypothetical protein
LLQVPPNQANAISSSSRLPLSSSGSLCIRIFMVLILCCV